MPVTNFQIQWPNGEIRTCFSPSSIVREHFKAGDTFPVGDFVKRSRRALLEADERVAAKFGYGCGHAASEIKEIEAHGRKFADSEIVRILDVE